MSIEQLRAIVTLLIIGSFVLITLVFTLAPIFGQVPATEYTQHLDKFSSIYSGVVGIIVGFLFGSDKRNSTVSVTEGSESERKSIETQA